MKRRGTPIGHRHDGDGVTTTDDPLANAGKIALWTKADSVTRFDRITIRPPR
jgi:hypothetical protein